MRWIYYSRPVPYLLTASIRRPLWLAGLLRFLPTAAGGHKCATDTFYDAAPLFFDAAAGIRGDPRGSAGIRGDSRGSAGIRAARRTKRESRQHSKNISLSKNARKGRVLTERCAYHALHCFPLRACPISVGFPDVYPIAPFRASLLKAPLKGRPWRQKALAVQSEYEY